MPTIHNFAEANDYLAGYHDPASTKYDLKKIRALMSHLGNPQDKLRVVHVAGTSGKTSTSYYVSALLSATGAKVGLTVSPHIDSIAERLQTNNQPISEQEFCRGISEFSELVEESGIKPSWFEFMIAFVFWYFVKIDADYLVVEVGLGGLLDATNILTRPDKVCIITDIGLDHINVLGNSLAEIAAQKAGIIHRGNQVFTYESQPAVLEVIQAKCKQVHATLHTIADPGMENFKLHNWQLAKAAHDYIADRDDLQHLTSQALIKTQQAYIPGRMEIIKVGSKIVILDGAHNQQKMTSFLQTYKNKFPNVRPAVLMAVKSGREYKELIDLLKPVATQIICTEYQVKQDLPAKSMPVRELAAACLKEGIQTSSQVDLSRAVEELLACNEEVLLVTGSLYLLGQVRPLLH